ncbi:MAG: APC family permease, partial [bacterium]
MTELRRIISFPVLVLYGLGTMVGGGFYALTGKVAGEAGMQTPLAFLVAGILASLCALAFAECSARFPNAAGPARYVEAAFGSPVLAATVGWLVIATGVISAATLAVATTGFVRDLLPVPEMLGTFLLVITMGAISARGISLATTVVVGITIIEVGTLVYLLVTGGDAFATLPDRITEIGDVTNLAACTGIIAGAFLAFYAFIGFEDMVTLAEEVKDVRQTLPRALILSLVLTLFLYVSVALLAILAVSAEQLAGSNTPLAELVADQGRYAIIAIGVVSILTGINGALVQIVMAARIAYGMAGRGQAPAWMGIVSRLTRTPLLATAAATSLILVLAMTLDLTTLARLTSGIIILIFGLVNASLWVIKGQEDLPPPGIVYFPRFLALLGALACAAILAAQLFTLSLP